MRRGLSCDVFITLEHRTAAKVRLLGKKVKNIFELSAPGSADDGTHSNISQLTEQCADKERLYMLSKKKEQENIFLTCVEI